MRSADGIKVTLIFHFLPVYEFRLPFQQDRPIQDELEDKCLGVLQDRDNLRSPGGVALTDKLTGPQQGRPKNSSGSFRIARNLRSLQRCSTAQKPVAPRRG
jgi:hypothetical protein